MGDCIGVKQVSILVEPAQDLLISFNLVWLVIVSKQIVYLFYGKIIQMDWFGGKNQLFVKKLC
ncbi:MAG: hypothetical protein CVU46_15795 [Chloroflexi bacterium HGW-Chloroflexi-8]|nr:MAG: hypothetical protein CVU46_15795 [Chloroflexi bacterium HGW-Chloroflexi-8]